MLADRLAPNSRCPVCGSTLAAALFDGGAQPLATLGWPETREAALSMDRYKLTYVQCLRCTHVWNRDFDYAVVPYVKNPNRMFNSGAVWSNFLESARDLIVGHLPRDPVVVDIGCGDGHFVSGISKMLQGRGRFMGFDPNASIDDEAGIEFHATYFDPELHMNALAPDAVILRHVIEHLAEPAEFLERLSFYGSKLGKSIKLFAEVPCIEPALSNVRLADFFFEHPAHFTRRSLKKLLDRAGDVIVLETGYAMEVVYGLVELQVANDVVSMFDAATAFREAASSSVVGVHEQLADLRASGLSIAIWGGTGKAAAFLHHYRVQPDDFPIVIDSDTRKVGTYVPGVGQVIRHRDYLKTNPVDVILIPTLWRARDIESEIRRERIEAGRILVEYRGSLVDLDQLP